MKNVNVMWVGLSAKKDIGVKKSLPLNIDTNTGKLVAEIEAQCRSVFFYRTNLVKFPPLDFDGKLRYPTFNECVSCYPELLVEIQKVNPHIVLLLGSKTATFVLNQLGFKMPKLSYKYQVFDYKGTWYIPIHHPSYIMVYKRKEKAQYVQAIKDIVT